MTASDLFWPDLNRDRWLVLLQEGVAHASTRQPGSSQRAVNST